MNFSLTEAGSHQPRILSRRRRLLALLWLYIGTALLGHGQELVTNGGFAQGSPDGWSVAGGWAGYVISPGSDTGGVGSWIGVGGSVEQVLNTQNGQTYVLTFSRQGYDSGQSPRATAMEVLWEGRRIQRFDFAAGDTAWRRPRFHLRATGPRSALTFLGFGSPSLDNVSVVPRTNDLLMGSVRIVESGGPPLENGELVLETRWEDFNGPIVVGQQQVYLGGTRSIGTIASLTNRFHWTNLPAGTHHLAVEFAGVRSTDIEVVVPTRPKVRFVAPRNLSVVEPGSQVRITAETVDNGDRIRKVRFSAGGEAFAVVDVVAPDPSANTDWTAGPEGFHQLRIEGLGADGGILDATEIRLQSLPPAVRAQSQEQSTGHVFVSPAAPAAQLFQVRKGGRLHSVELDLFHNNAADTSPVTVSLHTVEGGWPTSNRLASVSMPLSDAYVSPQSSARARFHFPSPPEVAAGRTYALVLESTGSFGTSLRASIFNTFLGGSVAIRNSGIWSRPQSIVDHDLVFVAWVIPGPDVRFNLVSPTAGTSVPTNHPLALSARLESGSGGTAVFSVDGAPVSAPLPPPFDATWSSPQPGPHVVQAAWTSAVGEVVWSDPVLVQVGDPPQSLPRISVGTARSREGDASLPPVVFRLSLDRPSERTVLVDYSTQDVSARAGQDFIATSGTVRFAPGQTEAYVFVRILPDTDPNGHRRFRLLLNRPVEAVLEQAFAYGLILEDDGGSDIAARLGLELGTGTATLGAEVPATVRTLRADGVEQSALDWTARIRLATTRSVTRTNLYGPQPVQGFFEAGVQPGHRFRTSAPLLITHARAAARGRATVWSEDGRRLGSVDLPAPVDGWSERPFERPVFIEGNTVFRFSILTADGSMPFSSQFPSTPQVIVESSACYAPGDTFPSGFNNGIRPHLDLSFSVLHWVEGFPERRIRVGPGEPWTGMLRLDAVGKPIHVVATDPERILNASVASVLVPLPSALRLGIQESRGLFQFQVEGPPDRRVRIQTGALDGIWTDISPTLRLDGGTLLWPETPGAGADFDRFHRVLLLE